VRARAVLGCARTLEKPFTRSALVEWKTSAASADTRDKKSAHTVLLSNSGGKDSTSIFFSIHDAVAFKMLPALYLADLATEQPAAGAAPAAPAHAKEGKVPVETKRQGQEAGLKVSTNYSQA